MGKILRDGPYWGTRDFNLKRMLDEDLWNLTVWHNSFYL